MNSNIIEEDRIEVNDSNFSSVLDSIVEDSLDDAPETPEAEVQEEPEVPQIPLNTPLVSDVSLRYRGADWFHKASSTSVTVAGLGGIGSYVAFLLSRLNMGHIKLYDPDVVEEVNMSGQLYGLSDIGMAKVSACSKIMRGFSNYHSYEVYSSAVDQFTGVSKITICGFDNMHARSCAFTAWLNTVADGKEGLFIDGRLAAEEFQVFCIRSDDDYLIKKYKEEYLFDDTEAEETVCSYKQTSFCATMIASVMVNLLVNYLTNVDNDYRNLPFKITYNGMTMQLNTYDV